MDFGYNNLLELAGAKSLAYEEFGTYQGDWWCLVTYEGRTFWLNDYFGSCSVCDAIQGEIDYKYTHDCGGQKYRHYYDGFTEGCGKCDAVKRKLIQLALGYLEEPLSQEEAEAKAAKSRGYDLVADDVVAFIQAHKIE